MNQGKIEILKDCEFETIIMLLDDVSATCLNAVQLIANLAENPIGQEKSKPYLEKINSIKSIERMYVDATLDVINWEP